MSHKYWSLLLLFICLFVRDLNGCIVTVSDAGHLSCVYLGTDPAIFVPPQVDSRELNYSKMDAEMSVLQQKIREKGGKSGELAKWFLLLWSLCFIGRQC